MKQIKSFTTFFCTKDMTICDARLQFLFAFPTIRAYVNTQMLQMEMIKKLNTMGV